MDLIRIATAHLVSMSAYSASKMHTAPLAYEKEGKNEYDLRTWREKAHFDETGRVCLPGMGFKQALDAAASRLGMKIPGKRNATYTKHFKGGILVPDLIPLPIMKDDLESVTISAHSTGKRTDGTRVPRTFPIIRSWEADVTFYLIDAEITKEVFERHLKEAGFFVGIGRFRPENAGTNGRFKVASIEWSERTIEEALAA